jgi:hypothetical protein
VSAELYHSSMVQWRMNASGAMMCKVVAGSIAGTRPIRCPNLQPDPVAQAPIAPRNFGHLIEDFSIMGGADQF